MALNNFRVDTAGSISISTGVIQAFQNMSKETIDLLIDKSKIEVMCGSLLGNVHTSDFSYNYFIRNFLRNKWKTISGVYEDGENLRIKLSDFEEAIDIHNRFIGSLKGYYVLELPETLPDQFFDFIDNRDRSVYSMTYMFERVIFVTKDKELALEMKMKLS